ncbi:hypothetical protein EDB92DRAFT_778999 [Lactarius akahatsu]|uniref:Crinkler effector protein N-terminal domain-containing protein n=1 Tax=Lactarius akahatsu TaxID=416441 RepID=A0AAD4LFS3_9AGAM|nr:hypothetical protein EDB92DRAFT_778999 [Lactarius akahatsu]
MSASITLNCLVYGHHHNNIFSVQIPGNGNVITLRKAIRDENKNTFHDVDADTLQLWNVYIPIDELSEEKINDLGLESKTPLRPENRLLGVFSGIFEDDHLHIVVRPEGFIQTNEPPRLQLNCLVRGGDRRNVFSVEIPSTENVSTLREAIKDENNITFRDVDAYTLTLWRVSIPNDSNFELKLSELDLVDEEQLFPLQVLSNVFTDPPLPEHVHIVVKPPPPHSLSQQPQASTSDAIGLWTKGMTSIAKLEASTFSDKLKSQRR